MAQTQCLHGINFADGTDKLINIRYGTIKVYNAGTDEWDHVESPHFDFTALIDSANFLDHAFFVNGVDANQSYNSSGTWSSTTNLGDAPIAKYVLNHKTRLYLGHIKINDTWYRSRVWYSDLPSNNQIVWGLETGTNLAQTASSAEVTSSGATFKTNNIKVGDPFIIETGDNAGQYTVRAIDSETQITLTETLDNTATNSTFWVGGNWFDVKTDDGDILTGFGENSNEIIPFKRNSLHRYNSLGGTLRQVKKTPGTGSNRSVINLNEYTYYYDPTSDAIRRFDGVNSIIISKAIEDLLKNMAAANKDNVVGWAEDGEFVEMYIGTTTTREGDSITNCVVRWDADAETWSTRTTPFVVEQSTVWEQSSKPTTYISTQGGRVLKTPDGYDYDGTAMSFELTDRPIFPLGDDVLVDFERVRIWVENGHELQLLYKLYYMPDGNKRWVNSDWIPLKGKADAELVEFTFSDSELRRACGIQVRFIQSSSHESFLIEKYKLYYSNPAIE